MTVHFIIMFLLAVLAGSSFLFTVYYFRQRRKAAETNKKLAAANIRIQQYLNAVDASNLVCITTPEGKFKYINTQYLEILGYTFDELAGKSFYDIKHKDTPQAAYDDLFKTAKEGNVWSGLLINTTKNGEKVFVDTSVVPIQNEEREITEFMSIRKDVTEIFRQQEQIKQQLTDPLTGFPNRTKMRRDLVHIKWPALAILNIDGFSTINAFYGLEAGDEILRQFSQLLNSKLKEHMKMYRLSGDEFAILAEDVREISDFNIFVRGVMREITEHKFSHGGNDIQLSLTVGTAGGYEGLLVKAGMAIKKARSDHKNLTTYDDVQAVNDQLRETIQYSSALRDAVRHDRIVPHYQPIVDAGTGKLYKYEALIRILDDENKYLPPMCFLELSKQLKLYNEISSMMIMKSIEAVKDTDLRISINFDKEDILNRRIQDKLFGAIKKYCLEGRITIEITESESIDNLGELSDFVSRAKEAGCLIAIDDFGTGYSNFMYILSLQPDFLKIDGSITRQMIESKRARLLTETIVGMCRNAGIKTIAEFVSSKELYDAMRDMGVDYVQGYYFGKPEPEFR